MPMVTRKRAPYSRCGRVWVVRSIANPAIDMAMGINVNMKRCLNQSEKKAMMRAKTKEAAQGGTECSCVPIWV